MLLKLNEPLEIEDLQQHTIEETRRLRELLLRGVVALPDPHRKNFYDIEDGSRIFYIDISPSGKVLLLAIWTKEEAPLRAQSALHMARTSAA